MEVTLLSSVAFRILGFWLLSALPIQPAIAQAQAGVDADHDKIEDVQIQHEIIAVEDLVDDAADIAGKHRKLEENAAACSGAAFDGFVDIAGPCKTKTHQHTDFKNAHKNDLTSNGSLKIL